MATDYTVYLNGGPCDGREKTLTQAQFNTRLTTCGGATYTYNPDQVIPGHRYIFDLLTPEGGSGGGGGGGPTATHAHKGWNDIQRSVNTTLPSALHRVAKLNRAALRAIPRRRRVHH